MRAHTCRDPKAGIYVEPSYPPRLELHPHSGIARSLPFLDALPGAVGYCIEIELLVALTLQAAFEPLFAVRGLLAEQRGTVRPPCWHAGHLCFRYTGADGLYRSLVVHFAPAPRATDGTTAHFHLTLQLQERQQLLADTEGCHATSLEEAYDSCKPKKLVLWDSAVYPVVEVPLVVPVFNEADTVRLFMDRVRQVFDAKASVYVEIIFVNDGSPDDTLERLLHVQQSDHRVRIVDLSRNFGKEAVLTAGLQATRGRVVVPIDVDLQDPPGFVSQMIACWREE